MTKIFVSYSRRNEDIARSVIDDVDAMGHSVWFDVELTGGQLWWDHILKSVRECNVFVFILDPNSLDSTACIREYSYAAALGKPILPILVSDGVSINLLPKSLLEIQHVDYRVMDKSAALKLVKAISDVPKSCPLPEPLPPSPEVPVSYISGLSQQINKDSLTLEEQLLLVLDLKEGLLDSTISKDIKTLIEKLRDRPDLFARTEREIANTILDADQFESPGEVKPQNSAGNIPDTGENIILVDSPVDLSSPNSQSSTLNPAEDIDKSINVTGETKLMVEARVGSIDEFKRLIELGADISKVDRWGISLHRKASKNPDKGILNYLESIMDQKGDGV